MTSVSLTRPISIPSGSEEFSYLQL